MKIGLTENEKKGIPVIGIILAALFLGYEVKGLYDAVQRAPGSATIVAATDAHPAEPWPVVDGLLANRERYMRAIGVEGIPEWSYYTPEYFADLRERRERVIAWSAAQPLPSQIVFVGVVHRSRSGDELLRRRIERAQSAIFAQVWHESFGASVVSVECAGSDDRLTPSEWLRISEVDRELYLSGFHPSEAYSLPTIRELRADEAVRTRAIVELGHTMVRCGEEWPFFFVGRLYDMSSHRADHMDELSQLRHALDLLRSEIILIRTLEYLAQVGGRKGVILQGDAHRPEVEALAAKYDISFRGIPRPLDDRPSF